MEAKPSMSQPGDNPYVGPRTFSRAESHLFFGREREARNLLSLVVSERLVLFYAQSGAGKSSLINTRLIPNLEVKGFEVLPVGRVSGGVLPGTRVDNIFVYHLLLSLNQGQDQDQPLPNPNLSLKDFLRDYGSGFAEVSTFDDEASSSEDGQVEIWPRALIIDQFEEILTAHLAEWQKRADFFDQLREALAEDDHLWIILSMREDYVAALDPYAHLLPDKLRARFYMQRMGYEAALEAVTKPVAQQRPFAPGVAEKLVDNLRQIRGEALDEAGSTVIGQFVEPVQLQVVCYQLWENLKRDPQPQITDKDLQRLAGGKDLALFVNNALAQFYEQAIANVLQMPELSLSEPELREWFNRQLITEAKTRGTVYQGEQHTGGLPNEAVYLLENQFLIRAEARAGGRWYELVHDRFVEPILEANQAWLQKNPLIQAAQSWQEANRIEDGLYRGRQLAEALADLPDRQALGPLVAEFLDASEKAEKVRQEQEAQRQRELQQAQALADMQRQRAEEQTRAARRLRRLALVLVIVFLLAAGAAIFGWIQKNKADVQKNEADTQRQNAVSQADRADKAKATAEAERELALTARSTAEAARSEAQQSALVARADQLVAQAQAAMLEKYPQRSLLLAAEAMQVASQLDERISSAEAILRQTLANAGGRSLGNYDGPVKAIAISPNNRWLVTGGGTTARLWDLTHLTAEPLGLLIPEGPITATVISPDSHWLVIAGGKTAWLWDLTTPTTKPAFSFPSQQTNPITGLAITADSRQLVISSAERVVQVWDLSNRNSRPKPLPVLEDPIENVAVSPAQAEAGNQWLAGAGGSTVYLWRLARLNTEPIILRSKTRPFTAIAISPDGRWLAAASDDTYLWDLGQEDLTADCVPVNPDQPSPASCSILPSKDIAVNAIAFSPDSKWLFNGNSRGPIQEWDLNSPELGPRLGATHTERVSPITAIASSSVITGSSDNRWLASGSEDRTIRLIDKAGSITLNGHDGPISTLVISSDNHWLVSGSEDQTARLWDLISSEPSSAAALVLPTYERVPPFQVAVSPDSRWLVVANDDGTLNRWALEPINTAIGEGPVALPLIQPAADEPINAIAISPDNHWLATNGAGGTTRLWDLASTSDPTTAVATLTDHQAALGAMAISSDNRWLITGGGFDNAVHLWDLGNAPDMATQPITLSGHMGAISTIALSPPSSENDPGNQWLVSASGDGTARLWDLTAQAESAQPGEVLTSTTVLTGHTGQVSAVAISPMPSKDDASKGWVATGDDQGGIRLWDLTVSPVAIQPTLVLTGSSSALPVSAILISRDSRHLIATLRSATDAYLWDLNAANPAASLQVLGGHNSPILKMALSPNGRWLATGDSEGFVRLWDLTDPNPSTASIVLGKHQNRIRDMTISLDNHWLITGSDDATIRLWTLRQDELVEQACQTAGRNFTPEEWTQSLSGEEQRETCPNLPTYLLAPENK
jgi:WD40 repeat protein